VSGASRLALLWVLLWSSAARAGDGDLVWKTIETDHFVVNYYEPLGDVAHRVAVVAERSHRLLAPAFDHAPDEKTLIVLVDDTDGANGFANVTPRNVIRLFATAPTGLSVLNDHDDWMYGLVAHEYTHILHLDTIGGLPSLYNKVFGKIWAPNQLQPRWVIEGVATYQESKQSSSGRTRSALFDMFLRVAVLADKELPIDVLSTGPRAFPHGTSAYLYGSHFLKYIFDRYGSDKVSEWSHDYGSTPIPYGLNLSVERVIGKSYMELYDEWREHMRQSYETKIEAIERRGRIEGRRLTFHGESNVNPIYTADGEWIVWRQSDGKSRGRFRRLPSGDNIGKAEDYLVADRAGGFDLMRNGDMILEQTRVFRTNYNRQDLWYIDIETGKQTALTLAARARDPEVSPDEKSVAFVKNGEGRSVLAVMPILPEAEYRIVWEGNDRYDQVTAPAWSPDGARLAFSAWRKGGYRDILIVDVASGKATELMRDRAIDADPVFSPDGKYVFYSSDRSGIYNIYAYELETQKTWQVTNVVGCALVPDISPDGKRLVYQGFEVIGYELYELPIDPSTWIEPELYINDRPDPTDIPDDEVAVSAPRDYRPLETLAPRSYQYTYAEDSFGRALSLTTYGADIAGRHSYNLGSTIGFTRGDVSVGASYAYRRYYPSLRLSANRSVSQRGGYIIDGVNTRYTETNYGATARVDLPVQRLSDSSSNISFNYDIDWFVSDEDAFEMHDPNAQLPGVPETDVVAAGISVSWTYSDSRGFNWTLGPQEGKSFTASVGLDHPSLGSDFHALNLSYRWNGFYKLPWGETSVLALRLAGGLTTTDRRRSGVFVLGGVPDQDIPRAIREQLRSGGTGYLRGYEPRSVFGRQFHLLNTEYRQILFHVERGFGTLPLYVRRVHLAGLFDAGDAFDDGLDLGDFKASVGGSLRFDLVFGYSAPGTVDIGYARGLTDDGTDELWLLLTSTL
jgi:hypothetical protein